MKTKLAQLKEKKQDLESQVEKQIDQVSSESKKIPELKHDEDKSPNLDAFVIYGKVKKNVHDLLEKNNDIHITKLWEQIKPIVLDTPYERLYRWAFIYNCFDISNQRAIYYIDDNNWFINFIDKQFAAPGQTLETQNAFSRSAETCLNAASMKKDYEPSSSFYLLACANQSYPTPEKNMHRNIISNLSSELQKYQNEMRTAFINFAKNYAPPYLNPPNLGYTLFAVAKNSLAANKYKAQIELLYSRIAASYYLLNKLHENSPLSSEMLKNEIEVNFGSQPFIKRILDAIDLPEENKSNLKNNRHNK